MKRITLALLTVLALSPPAYAAFRTAPAAAPALAQIQAQAKTTKSYLTTKRAEMVLPTVNAMVPLAVIQHLASAIPRLNALAATPGLLQYAKDQYNDQAYNVAAEYTAMANAMTAVLNNLVATFPKDGTNTYLAYEIINGVGQITQRTFTAAQLAPAVALVDTLLATIAD